MRWFIEHAFVIVLARAIGGQHLASFVFAAAKNPARSRSSKPWRS
jgi:hypothetical protein